MSFASGKCASVWGGSTSNLSRVVQWECRGAPSQMFTLRPAGAADQFFVVAEHSGKCLAVNGGSTADGAGVVQWPCSDGAYGNDVWRLERTGEGTRLRARHSNRCMAVWGGLPTDGADLVQWSCAATNNMLFDIAAGSTGGGRWEPVDDLPLVPAAAAAIDGGDLLLWTAYSKTTFGGDAGYTQTAVYDPETGAVRERVVTETGHDFFCPAISSLPDGKVIISGGSSAGRTSIYDPATDAWTAGPRLNTPRGYNSSATLSDGSVLTIGGSWSGGVYDKGTEIYRDGTWTRLPGVSSLPMAGDDPAGLLRGDNHYWLFPWTENRVFQAGPSKTMHWISVEGDGSVVGAGSRGFDTFAINGNAVMFEPGRILTVGGATAYNHGRSSSAAHVIDITGDDVTTTAVESMARPRTFHNSVVLPTGQVLVIGGVGGSPVTFVDAMPVMTPELFDPETNTFTAMAPMRVPRTYHSWALLLPDGRVAAGGGGLCASCPTNHANVEIFTPPYLLDGDGALADRPTITGGPRTAAHGTAIDVTTDRPVDSFVLVRRGSATHSVNTDQRRIPVSSTVSGGTYRVSIPSEAGIVLPGEYYLFAIEDGTPSVAHPVRVR